MLMVPFFDADDYYSVTNRATVPTEANGVVTTLFRTFSQAPEPQKTCPTRKEIAYASQSVDIRIRCISSGVEWPVTCPLPSYPRVHPSSYLRTYFLNRCGPTSAA